MENHYIPPKAICEANGVDENTRIWAFAPFVRFLIVGGANTILSYLIYFLLLKFLTYTLAYSIAYCVGIVVSYFLNARYVFFKPLNIRHFLRFPLVYLVQYGLGIVILKLLIETGGMGPELGMVIVILITIPVTFLLSKYLLVSRCRSGPGNLNKPISGESAAFDGPTGRGNGAEDGKKDETDTLSGVQGESGLSGLGGR